MKLNKPHKYIHGGYSNDGQFLYDLCICGQLKNNPLHTLVKSDSNKKRSTGKNARDNRIHKEGFDAGYKKALKDVIKCIERNEGSSRPKADVLKWINRELLK